MISRGKESNLNKSVEGLSLGIDLINTLDLLLEDVET